MKGKKYLAKNIGLLTLSQFGTKFLSFLLVPLYTYALSTTEYGTYDIFTTTISLLIPLLTLNVADSALRFTLDKDSKKDSIISICFKYILRGILLIIIFTIINSIFHIIDVLDRYPVLFVLLYISFSVNNFFVYLARGLEKIKEVAISGVISSITMLSLNILFLIPLKFGLTGYFYAYIIGAFAQIIYLAISIKIFRYVSFNKADTKLQKQILDYSKPLIINNISWWVSSASDRYIVTWMCGIAENGIYSVGYKIPSIINVFQTIFNQAWTLSAVKDYDPDDKNGFFTEMYNSYNMCMTIVCSILIMFTRILAKILYSNKFYIAWKYVPFLMIASVFGALAGYIGGIFGAVKDTKIFAKSSLIGAMINIVLNVILINYIGTIGAALATAVCYFVTWIIRVLTVRKYIKIQFCLQRDFLAYIILLIQSILFLCFKDSIYFYVIQICLLTIEGILFKKQFYSIYKMLKNKFGG